MKTIAPLVLVAAIAVSAAAPSHAESFRLRIGAGHPSPNLTYVYVAQSFFVPEVTRRVKEETEHTVRFIEAYAGTAAGVTEIIEATQKGILDIGLSVPSFEASRAELMNVSLFFPFSTTDYERQQRVARRMIEEVPQIQESMGRYNVRILAQSVSENYGLLTRKCWSTINELKGLKFAVAGSNSPWVEKIGGIALQMNIADNYTALQTGQLNGNIFFASGMTAFRLSEVVDCYTRTGFGSFVSNAIFMNQDSYDRLPREVAGIIDEVAWQASERIAATAAERDARSYAAIAKMGKLADISPEEQARWAAALAGIPAQALAAAEARALDARPVFEAYLRISREEGHSFPYEYRLD
jgi:C4-dicarboxylate-binding protein DctP